MKKEVAIILAAASFLSADLAFAEMEGATLFQKKCGFCHKLDNKGMGPPIVEMNSDGAVLRSAIVDGEKAMPSFGDNLDATQINALLAFIKGKQVKANPCASKQSGK